MRKNVASQFIAAQLINKSTGASVTSGTCTVYVTKDGGTQTAGGGTVTHEGNGEYSYAPTQAETNATHVAFTWTHTDAVTVTINVYPVAYDYGDAAGLGLSRLDAAVSTRSTYAGGDTSGVTTLLARIVGTLASGTHNPQSGDAYARLGAPAGASVSADVLQVKNYVDDIGVAGAGLTAVPWNASWDAEAQSEANDALVALGLDHLISAAVAGADVTDNSIIAKLVSKSATADWDSYANTTDSHEAIRDNMGTAQTGDAYARLGAPAGASTAADIAAINAKTTNLPADPAAVGSAMTLTAAYDAAKTAATQASVDDVPTNAELATALAGADDAVLAAIAALNNLSAAQVNAEVVDALSVDTYAQPGQGNPAATTTLALMLSHLYKAWRNPKAQTDGLFSLFADNGVTLDQKAVTAFDGTTFTQGKMITGA